MFLALLTRDLRFKEVKRLIQWANVFLGQKMSPSAPQAQERKNLCCVLGRRKLEISVKLNCCFRKSRGTRDQNANIHWIIEKAREFQKNIYFCFIDYAKAFDCVDHNKLWKILKEMGIPDHLTCPLRNLYAGQEATVRTGRGTTDWLEKEYVKAVYCHPVYLTYMQSTS